MYVELSDLEAEIPPTFLTEALDDDGDGVIDAWTTVQASACRAVDAALGGRFAVPFPEPYPNVVKEAAVIFAAEKCYTRRGHHDKENPFTARADALRRDLRAIGGGEQPLSPTIERQKPSVSIITEPARTHSASGRMSF